MRSEGEGWAGSYYNGWLASFGAFWELAQLSAAERYGMKIDWMGGTVYIVMMKLVTSVPFVCPIN